VNENVIMIMILNPIASPQNGIEKNLDLLMILILHQGCQIGVVVLIVQIYRGGVSGMLIIDLCASVA
jgi:hypothetical protein